LFEYAEDLPDYEFHKLLLFAAIPRCDVKPMAKILLSELQDLRSLLNARPERSIAFGLSEAAASLIATGAAALRAHKNAIMQKQLLNNWQCIVDYCRAALAHETAEQFRLLFLYFKNHVVAEGVHQRGTIDYTPFVPARGDTAGIGGWGLAPLCWSTFIPAAIFSRAGMI
jgi:DNA repair protein RadC